jgi:hypothetical protein
MAKRTPRAGRGAPAPARAAKTKSKKPAASGVEVLEEAPGMGPDAGIVIMTTVVLVAALLFVDALLGKFGSGVFFS